VSDEPLYCALCGKEECEHPADAEGAYCVACGVVPLEGGECKFFKTGGNDTGCSTPNGLAKLVEEGDEA
jgi:hypothetical protein